MTGRSGANERRSGSLRETHGESGGGTPRHNGGHFVWWLVAPLRPSAETGFVAAVISGISLITDEETGWDADIHEQDNPGNNMRTLRLSRTLAVHLHGCGLP